MLADAEGTTMDIAPGLLISVPQLRDPNFDHTVVLVLEHGEEGSFGLVVNRETDHTLAEFCQSQRIGYAGRPETKVHYGGPVGIQQGFVLFGAPLPGLLEEDSGREVGHGIWFGMTRPLLEKLSGQTGTPYRLMVGYAGWGPGQLEAEMADGAWLVGAPDAKLIFHTPPREVWAQALRGMGIDPLTIVRPGGGALN
jgi:putative transcriptional regulator